MDGLDDCASILTNAMPTTYSRAQFKFDTLMGVLVMLLKKSLKKFMSCAKTIYACITLCCIACKQWQTCSLSSHASPPLNLAHAQYLNYTCPNHSNHGQCMYLIQTQQQASGPSTGSYC